MELSEQITEKIKAICMTHISDAEIMLFGSLADGGSSSQSDIDLLLITSTDLTIEEKTPLRTKIRKDLLLNGLRTDILIQSKGEIERKRRLPGHFIKNIMRDAVLL